jgi:hypothetical protein
MINLENQESPFPKTSRKAYISFILGLCSLFSLIPFVFLLNLILYYPFSAPYFQLVFPYLLLIFVLIWMLLPIFTVFSATKTRNGSIDQTSYRLSTAALVLGYISLLVPGTIFCTIVALVSGMFGHFS